MHIIFSWQWKWFWRRPGCFWIDIHGVIIFWNFTFQNIPKENGKENGLKYWMNIRNDSRYSIKVRILDVRIFFWENGFRWWLFGLFVLRDPLYESERFKESYYNYPLSFFKNKIEMSLFFTPKILRKCHYLHTSNFGRIYVCWCVCLLFSCLFGPITRAF